ncbi:MAG: prolipoprotein diacylglyceryl transferase [Proteobacteria bacterium]|nr:prolipoprotein diacylglyceryl transferase [Pseudomonadota bacterium]MCP4917176.1 prolipoprotein diacylglyceryl transferase [Pseudomonadota bacterium]
MIPWFETPSIPIPNPWFPDLAVHAFGLLVALGFWCGTWLAGVKCKRDGLDPEIPYQLVGWLIVSTFVGGHVFHAVFYDTERLLADPAYIFQLYDGLSSTGGLVSSVLVTIIFFKFVKKVPYFAYADAVAWGLMTGWVLGRLGCFVAHDHPGAETDFFLGVQGMCPPQGPGAATCHDMGLYEAMFAMVAATAFHILDRKPRHPGFFIAMICLFYGPYRFLSDFLRHQELDERYFGLTPAQYFALGLIVLGSGVLYFTRGWAPIRGSTITGPKAD